MHNTDPYPRRDRTWPSTPGPLAREPHTPGRRTLPAQYLVSPPSPPRRSRSIKLIGVAALSLCGLGLGFLMAYGSVPMPSFTSASGRHSRTGDAAPVAEAEAGVKAEAAGGWGADDGTAGTPRSSPAVRAAPETTEASGPSSRPSEPAWPADPAKAAKAGKKAKAGMAGRPGRAGRPVKTPAKSGGRPPAAPGGVERECARRFPGDPTRQHACAAALHGVFGHR